MEKEILARRMRQVLHDKKWKIFLRRSRPWRHIPFVKFVLAAGSMATGNVHERSDFDVIVAARQGRIFTARFFSIFAFSALGWRRPKLSHKDAARNKICLNHFVTGASYEFAPPRNTYSRRLYRMLVPIYGGAERVNEFLAANAGWMGARRTYRDDLRHVSRDPSALKRWLEARLAGRMGDQLERFFKRVQIARIERSMRDDPPGYRPRIRYGDEELEFHPDTKRIQVYLQREQ